MPNCLRAAERLAEAFVAADELAHLEFETEETAPFELQEMGWPAPVENLGEVLKAYFKELGRPPFDGYHHDMANLRAQIARPNPYFIRRYAEDLQKQILSQGLLDLIDCQTRR